MSSQKKVQSLQIEARTIFCDDIRREDNGKAFLIGVYMDDLVPIRLPAEFPLSIWIQATGFDTGKHPFAIKIAFPGVEKKFRMRAEMIVPDDPGPLSLTWNGIPAEVHKSGFISVELEVNGEIFSAGKLPVRDPQGQRSDQDSPADQ